MSTWYDPSIQVLSYLTSSTYLMTRASVMHACACHAYCTPSHYDLPAELYWLLRDCVQYNPAGRKRGGGALYWPIQPAHLDAHWPKPW